MAKKEYVFGMFILCFLVWVFVVDQAIVPNHADLHKHIGTYSRYRVKKWSQDGKLGFLKDELMVYAMVKGRERIYYIDYFPQFESSLKRLQKGTPVVLHWENRFPKVWRRELFDLRNNQVPVLRYSAFQLEDKQKEVWKFTGIMGGIFLILTVLGFINKPGRF